MVLAPSIQYKLYYHKVHFILIDLVMYIMTLKTSQFRINASCIKHIISFYTAAQTLVHTSHPIIKFDVGRSTSYITGNSIIPFDSAQVNVGDAIQPASGVFTVPVDGTYLFTFTGVKTNTVTDSFIQLRKNGVTVASAFAPGLPNVVGFSSIHTMLDLVAGDLIYLYLVYGTLYDDANSHTHFTGSLKVPSEVV